MKKVISLSLLMTGFGQAAFASHPHDRVCVASGPIDFVFQYAIGRTYENGNANKDSHKIAAEASYSSDDYLSKAEKFTSEIVTMKSQSTKIAIALKSSRGE
ncbi:MAG TPA: hypothetical protein VN132_02825, partial [Bdellovibrio sp.]|nr:hypothetical protein [Bdellovibrio sp.]